MKVYVLTREINEYHQDGEYFEGVVYSSYPNEGQLLEAGVPASEIDNVLKNRGRVDLVNEWWNIVEVELK